MLRIHQIANSEAAKKYYTVSDYFLETPGQWIGKGAELLGLSGKAKYEDFCNLCDNLDPRDGQQLTAKNVEGRRTGWDFNFNATKSVSIARELLGDSRVEAAHREAVDYAMAAVEADMATRVRTGGKDEDRKTSNLVAMHTIHRTTRPNKDDQLPDMGLHSHVGVFNATYDPEERKWKAAQIGGIKKDANWYEALYHNRLAQNLKQLGYGIRRKERAFEIAGVSNELIRKFSRRTDTIEEAKRELEEKFGVKIGQEAKAKLGATTRLNKVEFKEDDLTKYWVSRLTQDEKTELSQLQGRDSYRSNDQDAVGYAISHAFERQSVVGEKWLYGLALRHGIGSVTPEGVMAEAKKQGVLLKDGQATTKEVLAEEGRIIRFAREGRGTVRPLGNSVDKARVANGDLATLSPEQQAICRHVWESQDRVVMIRGAAGTGKTRTMRAAIDGISKPVVVLAPSAEASRGVLRKEGFADADTVARFLVDEDMQEKARGGVIWIDEAGLLGIRQVAQLFDAAKGLNARVVLQGDKKQHGSVERGATLRVLEEFAGLPVAELKDIRRQRGEYKAAVASLSRGDMVAGFDKLAGLGWIVQAGSNKQLVDDYMVALATKKASQKDSERVIVVAPTHAEGDEITAEIRARLKVAGRIGKDERTVERLVPLNWTEAERGDLERYEGTEVMQFHRNSGAFKAGERVQVADWKPGQRPGKPKNFAVYGQSTLQLAVGDAIRITATGKDKTGWHKLNNGSQYTVAGFSKGGDIKLSNGWTIAKDFGHLSHGYTTTSHASQGKTVDRVLVAMGNESLPAISAEQFYVSVSRGREKATIYSDLSADQLRDAIQKADTRKSATELMGEQEEPASKMWEFVRRMAGRLRRERQMEIEERSLHNERHTA